MGGYPFTVVLVGQGWVRPCDCPYKSVSVMRAATVLGNDLHERPADKRDDDHGQP